MALYPDTLQPASEQIPAARDPRTERRALLRRLDADIAHGVLSRAQAIAIAEYLHVHISARNSPMILTEPAA